MTPKNTKYLTWGDGILTIHFHNVSIVCNEVTSVYQPIGTGWQRWRIVHYGRFSVTIPSYIARQLAKHLVFVNQGMDVDELKIKFT